MKHLKKFNESIYNYEELREFCYTHLAYLKDQGFSIIINSVQIMIHKDRYMSFNYDDIKYDFIPFIENFNNKYGIKDYIEFDNYLPVTLNKNIFRSEFKLSEILNEKDFYGSPISGYLTCITFKLKPFER